MVTTVERVGGTVVLEISDDERKVTTTYEIAQALELSRALYLCARGAAGDALSLLDIEGGIDQ